MLLQIAISNDLRYFPQHPKLIGSVWSPLSAFALVGAVQALLLATPAVKEERLRKALKQTLPASNEGLIVVSLFDHPSQRKHTGVDLTILHLFKVQFPHLYQLIAISLEDLKLLRCAFFPKPSRSLNERANCQEWAAASIAVACS